MIASGGVCWYHAISGEYNLITAFTAEEEDDEYVLTIGYESLNGTVRTALYSDTIDGNMRSYNCWGGAR